MLIILLIAAITTGGIGYNLGYEKGSDEAFFEGIKVGQDVCPVKPKDSKK